MSGIPMGGGKNFSGIRTETFFDEKVTGPGFFYETNDGKRNYKLICKPYEMKGLIHLL